jgi:hypothetical protein
MNKAFFKYGILLAGLLCSSVKESDAQIDTLQSMIIVSTGSYQGTIADANKISDNPVVQDSTKKLPVKGYAINSKKINPAVEVDPIPAAQINGEPLTKLYNGLVKIGFGNYTTPYGEAWYNNLRSKEYERSMPGD